MVKQDENGRHTRDTAHHVPTSHRQEETFKRRLK